MKEIRRMYGECKTEMEVVAMTAVIVLGIIGWAWFCYSAPQWLVGTLCLPMAFVILNFCGRLKRELEKEGELRQMNEYEQACEEMRKEAAEMRKGE